MDIEEMSRYVQAALQKAMEAEAQRLRQQAMERVPLTIVDVPMEPSGTIVEGSIVYPVSDPARLIGEYDG